MDENKEIEGFLDKLKKTPTGMVITFIMSLSTLGIGGYFGSIWYDSIDKAVIKSENIKEHVFELVDQRIEEKLNDPITWIEVLGSKHVERYAKDKAAEVRESVKEELIKSDSSRLDFVVILGKALGIRDEDVVPTFSKMMKEYIKGDFTTRSVRATF